MSKEEYRKRHERTDKISGLLGQYMLQGYRMLGTCCDKCGTVLLKYRDKDNYCVACFEVDVAEEPAKQPTLVEHQMEQEHPLSAGPTFATSSDLKDTPKESSSKVSMCNAETVAIAVNAINDKILWASSALKSCHSTEESIRLCNLLKVCGETLRVLQDLKV